MAASVLKAESAAHSHGDGIPSPLVKGVGCVYCWRRKKRSFVRACGKGGWFGLAA